MRFQRPYSGMGKIFNRFLSTLSRVRVLVRGCFHLTSDNLHGSMLSDEYLSDERDDRFSHSTYVDTILEIVSRCRTPHHIGMFGQWGTGKSTILKFLENRITKNDQLRSEYIFFYIDSWKLTKESFRQQLLESLNERLGGKVKKIEDRLWNIHEVGQTTEFKTDPLALAALVTLVLFAIVGFILKLVLQVDVTGYLLAVTPAVMTAPLIVALRSLSKASMAVTLSTKKIIPQVQSPREFQNLFIEIIQNRGNKTLIIAIDNLDRCESRLAIEMLGTIKTFMDIEGCIYIIACDDLALERHVVSERHVNDQAAVSDTKEFLRKFFQTTIKIAPFLDGSLYKFADEQNKKFDNSFDDKVVFVVATAFRKNPRRIKQFLNNLYAMWLTCKRREDLKIITPEGIITSNFGFMAKILVLKDESPDFYAKLDDPTILTQS